MTYDQHVRSKLAYGLLEAQEKNGLLIDDGIYPALPAGSLWTGERWIAVAKHPSLPLVDQWGNSYVCWVQMPEVVPVPDGEDEAEVPA